MTSRGRTSSATDPISNVNDDLKSWPPWHRSFVRPRRVGHSNIDTSQVAPGKVSVGHFWSILIKFTSWLEWHKRKQKVFTCARSTASWKRLFRVKRDSVKCHCQGKLVWIKRSRSAVYLSVDGNDFQNGAFRKRGHHDNQVVLFKHKSKMTGNGYVFKFLRRSVDGKHLMRSVFRLKKRFPNFSVIV